MATEQPPTFFVEDSNALMHPRDRSNERRRMEHELRLAKDDTEAALKALDTAVARLEAHAHMFLTLPSGRRVEVRHVEPAGSQPSATADDPMLRLVVRAAYLDAAKLVDSIASDAPGHRDDERSPRGALSSMAERLRKHAELVRPELLITE